MGAKLIMENIKYVLDYIYKKSPLQQKKIESFIEVQDEGFIIEFNDFLNLYSSYLKANNLSIDFCLDAYLKMINDMFRCQVKFMKSGEYPVSKTQDAIDNVYTNQTKMLSYMIGLALSQYLWKTHYEMFMHLKFELNMNKDKVNSYLEIGPGHGLFLKSAINLLSDSVEMTAIDISPVSLDISKSIIKYFYPNKKVNFINEDILNLDLQSSFDFIVMGEVIEHVENPKVLLHKINKLLAPNGQAFISTCINCPMIDHLYHFKTVDEIREMLNRCGLEIVSEKVLPVESLDMSEIIERKITINYSAIVRILLNES